VNTEKKKVCKPGLYFLPLVIAVPVAAAMILAVNRVWPYAHKMLSILIKLVVKA